MAKQLDFETAVKELEKVVNRLEQDELPLEDALKAFEEGIKLSRHCVQCLDAAEKRIAELTRGENGRPIWKTWEEDRE
jgi:exodeoxyribonuclease VII small subunit